MRFPVQITLAAAILCSASAFAQALDAASGDNATPSRFSCLSSSGQALTVWADRHRAVVAVAPGPGDPRLPAFAAPLVHQPVAALLQGYEDNPPAGFTLPEGSYYNRYFPGHAIKMPKPIST